MRRELYKVWLGFAIVCIVIFVASVTAAIVLSQMARDVYVQPVFIVSYSVICPVSLTAASLFMARYFTIKNELKTVRIENNYYFGEPSMFYNYVMFAERVNKLEKKFKEEPAYIISFTASDLSIMLNPNRNQSITKLACGISHYLIQYFTNLPRSKKDNIAYCYYHGSFIIYYHGNEEEMAKFREDLENASYQVANDNLLNVYVKPTFGIKLIDRDIDLFNNIDDASVARSVSEKIYEEARTYSPSYRKGASAQEVEEIQLALKNNEFVVYYQPKYLLSAKQFISAEALVRWNSKVHGIVPPAKFIEKAEYSGLIHDIDIYVFRHVCQDIADQKKRGRKILPVSVNFSQREFHETSFLYEIDSIMKEYNVDPYNIEIEITERTAMTNPFKAKEKLGKLRAKGIKIAMDDYGVDKSNLSTLNTWPIDTIKIDKKLIDGVVSNAKTKEIIRLIINLCKTNGIEVVAEGVDSADQVEVLRKLKCDTIQGFYFSKPLPKIEYEKLISKTNAANKEGK